MTSDELKIIGGNKNLIICFGGMALKFGGILPFEFLNYLSSIYKDISDLIFYIDSHQCWYHKGIRNITSNVNETSLYLNDIIEEGNYNKVIFMGTSAGGYGAILFGSLCKNVGNVVSFIPQTIIKNPVDAVYSDLKNVIKHDVKYVLYADKSIQNVNDEHHISHCENIECFPNVEIMKKESCNMKELRDDGTIKQRLDSILFDF